MPYEAHYFGLLGSSFSFIYVRCVSKYVSWAHVVVRGQLLEVGSRGVRGKLLLGCKANK